jgi:hypothetical protein
MNNKLIQLRQTPRRLLYHSHLIFLLVTIIWVNILFIAQNPLSISAELKDLILS